MSPRVRRSPFQGLHTPNSLQNLQAAFERLHGMLLDLAPNTEALPEDEVLDEVVPAQRLHRPRHFRWLKQGGEYPSYDNLAFSYRGNVFSVKLYECQADGSSSLEPEEIQQMRDFAKENNLIPCGFPIDAATHEPLETGWNLLSLEDGSPIAPAACPPQENAKLSAWEEQSLRTMTAAHWLSHTRRGQVQNVCTLPEAVPQIFFQDGAGNRCWAIVQDDNKQPDLKQLLKEYPALQDCDGYIGVVRLLPAEGDALLRTNTWKTEFSGLNCIYLAPTSRMVTSADSEDLLGQPPPEQPEDEPEQEVSGKGCLLFLVGALAALLAACSAFH